MSKYLSFTSFLSVLDFRGQQNIPDFLKSYQNYQANSANSNALSFLIFIIIATITVVACIVILVYIWNYRTSGKIIEFKTRAANYLKQRAHQRLKALKATNDQITVFFDLMKGGDNFNATIENPEHFEYLLNNYKNTEQNPKKIEVAETLRDLFNFNFFNDNIEFNTTKLLPEKIKVRAYLEKNKKKANYLTTVIHNKQDFFSILPPKKNGHWINIKDFNKLELRVMRKKISEYQMHCRIITQTDSVVPEVYLRHTDQIIKFNARYYTRYNITASCLVARFEESNLKQSHFYEAQIKDLSQGGACIRVPEKLNIQEGGILEIKMNIKKIKSLFGRLITINKYLEKDYQVANVEFSGISMVERIIIERYIKSVLQMQAESQLLRKNA